MATSTYSDYEPNGNVTWKFRCVKETGPEQAEVFQGTANPDSGGVPQAVIDDLYEAGWRVTSWMDRNHTATLDTGTPTGS